MALNYRTQSSVSVSSYSIRPVNSCSTVADLVYEDGLLKMPAYGLAWTAVSGPWGNGPLPMGWYQCSNLRRRTNSPMVRDGVGFSVDLDPLFPTTRTLLRIHPDGNVPGTLGCVGINDPDVQGCYDALKQLMPKSDSIAYLEVKSPK
jgi:hypothetical protein